MSADPRLVAGVDGCPAGWVAAIGDDPSYVWLAVGRTLSELLGSFPKVAAWAVDIPIGLTDTGARDCDLEARRRLGRNRAASVFPAPPHAAIGVNVTTYNRACRAAERATGKRISKQAWNLTKKIREARNVLIDRPALRRRLFETHPELTFARLAGGEGLAAGKKTPDGQQRRETLLAERFGEATVRTVVRQARATRGVGVDDALDAMACWLAAERAVGGVDESLPETPPHDPDGLPCGIRF